MDCPSNLTLAAAWATPGRVLTINDLGEGLPLDEAAWPWPADPGR